MIQNIAENELTDMLKQAVYQQLFLGANRIMGRLPNTTMQMKDVGEILNKFILEIKENLFLLQQKNFDDFLKYFENAFKFDLREVKKKIYDNFREMGDLDGDEIIIIYMVLTKLLEKLREESYLLYGFEHIIETYEKNSRKKFTENIRSRLQKLAATNNENISLLYNLCFIRSLSEVFKNKAIEINAKKQITKKVNLIVEKLMKN